ncbi:hypothetical protein NX02_08520 [Sphingomonas sanxanigenens DSM 19645 = NX02]|uniref:DNA 3'-5' helicase n=2 Tax=Sphingomonas sanxanigenens TaxID=397260 RepID=W0AAA9_9SPHN|nr:hypothetical protein NX02_08520 [Sphingomonas sanxanigenens DSM 19645 = NX02]
MAAMARSITPLSELKDAQKLASDPREHIWLSASAGTGKTHVLSARVLRLLLGGARPESILCLTFTKAGAAEMAERIHARLAYWVRLSEKELRKELFALGENPRDDVLVAHARTLFASVIDAQGGGLRIQTIHAFAQALLAGFPLEAGLIPGFRPMEGREEAVLQRRVLAELLVEAEAGVLPGFVAAIQALSLRLGEGGAEGFLQQCARAPDALEQLPTGISPFVRRAFEVPEGDIEAALAEACSDTMFDLVGLRRISAANAAWGTKTALAHTDIIAAWLGAAPPGRVAMLPDLMSVPFTAKGEPRKYSDKLIAAEPDYSGLAQRLGEACRDLIDLRTRAAFVALLGPALEAGRSYARAYAEAKRRSGLLDFDDLIRRTVALLQTEGMGEWIRYKLDLSTDHVLVDEAQDTNAQQWAIVRALADEFFAGEGTRDGRIRTLFAVGDFKQAIYGFQGTNPLMFEAAAQHFARQAADPAHVARLEAEGYRPRPLHRLSLNQSFRSTAPVLELVDMLIDQLGHDQLGLLDPAEPHKSAVTGPGIVTLWQPIAPAIDSGEEGEDAEGEEEWLADSTRAFATRLARQIREWLAEPLWLESKGRPLRPEDIMILVRKRGDLASLIVARLYAENVPVAGVDRLRLDAPLGVQDLLAAVRFALQPGDDLNLAALLVSPLIGWTQDQLYDHGRRQAGTTLFERLRQQQAMIGDTLAALSAILNAADFSTPYRFLEDMLSGPLDGRRKLLGRLGEEARDPIEELLSTALAFEADAVPSLQTFIDWFDRGEVEIKRDPAQPQAAVRVMTAHGAKGLQAPLVILADAATDPDAAPARALAWNAVEGGDPVPVFRARKDEMWGGLKADAEELAKRDREEHWRLLYVALTRAEERLVIGGALGRRAKNGPPERSWHAAVAAAMDGLGIEPVEDVLWGGAQHFRGTKPVDAARRAPDVSEDSRAAEGLLPDWLLRPAPEEARPPRPLAPSSIGEDRDADPPPGPAMRAAAERGRLLHALFERLPALPQARREAAGLDWLEGAAGVADADDRRKLVGDVLAVIGDPRFAPLFVPEALAEAPVAAVVDGEVIAGTVDRLLVTDADVLIVDFKTGRRAPATVDSAPVHHLRQISAYAAALKVIFPDRQIRAGLLYTAAPVLLELTPALIAAHKPRFAGTEQSLIEPR